jgi:hypothetical protein
LGYRFLAEAKRLWELELMQSKLTTIQAALFLNGSYNLDGVDAVGWRYASQAIAMADKLHLFAAPPSGTSEKMRIAREFTAWTLFCWQGYVLLRVRRNCRLNLTVSSLMKFFDLPCFRTHQSMLCPIQQQILNGTETFGSGIRLTRRQFPYITVMISKQKRN